jgi:hypothetical protein
LLAQARALSQAKGSAIMLERLGEADGKLVTARPAALDS